MKRKISTFDNAFLFILSFFGILISFQSFPSNLLTSLRLVPFLFLGIIWPFYIGYLNGALKRDSIAERIRGWIYFFISTGTYFAFYVSNIINVYRPYLTLIISIPFWLLTYLFIKWLNSIFDEVNNINNKIAYAGTFVCSLWLSFVFNFTISIYFDMSKDFPNIFLNNFVEFLFFLIINFASFIVFVFYEKGSSQIILLNTPVIYDEDNKTGKKIREYTRNIKSIRYLFMSSLYGTSLFHYIIEYDLVVRLYIFVGYYLWIAGSITLLFKIPLLPIIYYLISILSLLKGLINFTQIKYIDYTKHKMTYSNLYTNLMIISFFIAAFTLLRIVSHV